MRAAFTLFFYSPKPPNFAKITAMSDWKEYIVADPEVLRGKPTIKGTRLSIEFLLERLADGWTEEMLLDNFPRLTKEHLKAVYAFLTDCKRDRLLFLSTTAKAA